MSERASRVRTDHISHIRASLAAMIDLGRALETPVAGERPHSCLAHPAKS
jgi:hypothetical protein